MSISNFDSKHIKISIQDTGIGIINEEIKYLGTLSKEQSNKNTSGFGLCISNLLANYLGNNTEIKYGIHLNTEINKGSRFWFLIQNFLSEKNVSFFDEDGNYIEKEYKTTGELINNAHNYFECHNLSPKFMDINKKNKEMDSSSYLSSSSEETSEQRIENNNLNICKCPKALIVDDNPFNLMVCKNLLNKFCIISDISNSGVEAIEKIKSIFNNESEFCKFCKFYKFIFMDIDMPIKNGYETTKELLPLFKNHGIHCKIFALSAFNGKEDREKALESGMIDYLCKPLSKDNLINFFSTHFSELKFVCQ